MKKFLVVLTAILLTIPMMAQDFSGVACQQGQVYNSWHKWLDYINIVMPIDIYKYEKIYLCPIDVSGVQWPDKNRKSSDLRHFFPPVRRKFHWFFVILQQISCNITYKY